MDERTMTPTRAGDEFIYIRHTLCFRGMNNLQNLPNDNNDEIQHVPTVSHVRVLVHHQTVSDNLQKGLDCENNEEGILNCFLETDTHKKRATEL